MATSLIVCAEHIDDAFVELGVVTALITKRNCLGKLECVFCGKESEFTVSAVWEND